jgi:hypothetical protein
MTTVITTFPIGHGGWANNQPNPWKIRFSWISAGL